MITTTYKYVFETDAGIVEEIEIEFLPEPGQVNFEWLNTGTTFVLDVFKAQRFISSIRDRWVLDEEPEYDPFEYLKAQFEFPGGEYLGRYSIDGPLGPVAPEFAYSFEPEEVEEIQMRFPDATPVVASS